MHISFFAKVSVIFSDRIRDGFCGLIRPAFKNHGKNMTTFTFRHGSSLSIFQHVPTSLKKCLPGPGKTSQSGTWQHVPHMHVRTGGFFSSKPGNADRIFRCDFGCFRIHLGNLSVKCVISLKAKQPRISRTDKKTIKDPQVDPGIGKMTAPKHPFNTRSSSSEGCVEPNDMWQK